MRKIFSTLHIFHKATCDNYFAIKFLSKLSLLNTCQLSRGADRDMANILLVSHILQHEIIAKYEKREYDLPILHEVTCDNYFTIKCFLKLNIAGASFTCLLHWACLVQCNTDFVQTSRGFDSNFLMDFSNHFFFFFECSVSIWMFKSKYLQSCWFTVLEFFALNLDFVIFFFHQPKFCLV